MFTDSADSAAQAQKALGGAVSKRITGLWTDSLGSEDDGLDGQLAVAKAFLAQHRQFLQGLGSGTGVNLFISWSPRQPQDGLIFDVELIALLASLNGYVLLDTHVEPDEEE